MLFITNPRLRKLEAFMQEIPNFPPKGAKVDFDSLEDEILLFEIENVIINVKPPNENLRQHRTTNCIEHQKVVK